MFPFLTGLRLMQVFASFRRNSFARYMLRASGLGKAS
jgi:hypothetical protein